MILASDQAAAFEAFKAFKADPAQTLFALLGYAGTGKTFTMGLMQEEMGGQVVMATPTHKATNVLRRSLKAGGAVFEAGYDYSSHQQGRMITATTAQMIGIRPVISDEQDENGREFGKVGSGFLPKVNPDWIVVDEVSMLSNDHLMLLEAECMRLGAKLVIMGDPGQLPPVNADPISWSELPNVAVLDIVKRQAGDSMIKVLAEKIRNGEDWREVAGNGITHDARPGKAFLDQASVPSLNEADRSVFIAYTNRIVDEVQELACREVYGHGRQQFEEGQVVISETRFETEALVYMEKYGRSYPRRSVVANNADELVVNEFGGAGKYGVQVELALASGEGKPFHGEYLSPEELGNKRHPFNVAVSEAFRQANALQKEWKDAGMPKFGSLNTRRGNAWAAAFELKDGTIISFRHPFATTSHKSQGSTYLNAFVDATDIERFPENAKQSLYVAATRPSNDLVIG